MEGEWPLTLSRSGEPQLETVPGLVLVLERTLEWFVASRGEFQYAWSFCTLKSDLVPCDRLAEADTTQRSKQKM